MNTIILSEETVKDKHIIYYLTKVDKEQSNLIEAINNKEEANIELRKIVKKENAILIAVGDGMDFTPSRIEPLFEKLDYDTFKCYDLPMKSQTGLQGALVKMCQDTKTCWQSALRAIGYSGASGLRTPAYYTAYALIWKTIN